MAYNLDKTATPALQFKLGTQADMNTMLENNSQASESLRSGTHGTFYLTQDTHRLYVGNADRTISEVNSGILTVSTLPSSSSNPAPSPGQFYYLTGQNILAIYAGSDKWIQVNSSTSVNALTNTVTTTSGVASIQTQVTNSDNSTKQDSYSIQGASGITVSSSGKAITLTGNVDSLSAANATGGTNGVVLTLDHSDTGLTDSTMTLKQGSNMTIAMDSGAIKFTAKDTTNSTVTGAAVDYDSTAQSPTDEQKGGFKITVTDSDNAAKTGYIRPVIKYGSSANTTAVFDADTNDTAKGIATLDVYTTTEVSNLIAAQLRTFNSMNYKGKVTSTLPTSNVQIGDTYIIDNPNGYISHGGHNYPNGSMIIASGSNTEDAATGYIDNNGDPIAWDWIDSAGSDTTYSAANDGDYGFKVSSSGNEDILAYDFGEGTDISLSVSGDAPTGRTLTISHGAVTCTPTTDPDGAVQQYYNASTPAFTIISGITVSQQGHVTGYTTRQITLRDSADNLLAIARADTDNPNATKVSVSQNVATVALGYRLHRQDNSDSDASNSFNIASDTLTISNTANSMNVNINLAWGSF